MLVPLQGVSTKAASPNDLPRKFSVLLYCSWAFPPFFCRTCLRHHGTAQTCITFPSLPNTAPTNKKNGSDDNTKALPQTCQSPKPYTVPMRGHYAEMGLCHPSFHDQQTQINVVTRSETRPPTSSSILLFNSTYILPRFKCWCTLRL